MAQGLKRRIRKVLIRGDDAASERDIEAALLDIGEMLLDAAIDADLAAYAAGASGALATAPALTLLPVDTLLYQGRTDVYSLNVAGTYVDVGETGIYAALAHATFEHSVAAGITSGQLGIVVDAGGGFAYKAGSLGAATTVAATELMTLVAGWVGTLNAGEKIGVGGSKIAGLGTLASRAGNTRLLLRRCSRHTS